MRKLSQLLYNITGVLNIVLITVIIAMTFLQVFTRYVINASIPWAQELTIYCLVWLVFLGCSMGMRKHEVASLNLLVDALPYLGKQILRLINTIILTVFMVILIRVNHVVVLNAMPRLSGMMRIPMGYVNLALSVMAGLTCLYGIIDIYDYIVNIIKYVKGDRAE